MSEIYIKISQINEWANELVSSFIKQLSFEFMRKKTPYRLFGDIIVHLFDPVNIWINRLMGKSEKVSIRSLKDFNNLDELLKTWKESDSRFVSFTENLIEKKESYKIVLYRNSKGQEFRNSIEKIYLHISNHGYQHRGQKALLLRIHEKEPILQLDTIAYFRSLKN